MEQTAESKEIPNGLRRRDVAVVHNLVERDHYRLTRMFNLTNI